MADAPTPADGAAEAPAPAPKKRRAASPDVRTYRFLGPNATVAEIGGQKRHLYNGSHYRFDARDSVVQNYLSSGLFQELA